MALIPDDTHKLHEKLDAGFSAVVGGECSWRAFGEGGGLDAECEGE